MVKFDIVSGFLGAGKTTYIKKILPVCKALNEKLVLIENEFGKVSVDTEILRVEGFDVYELTKGCVCCTLKEDFAFTLQEILTQNPQRIIFEPSGIFIIEEIFNLFKRPEIASQCYINSITTIVDGLNYHRQRNYFSRFLEDQIDHASALVISKSQYLNSNELDAIVKDLKTINSSANIVLQNWDELSEAEILMLLECNNLTNVINHSCPNPAHIQSHDRHAFETIGWPTSRIVKKTELEAILEEFVQGKYGRIVRGKGFLKGKQSTLEFDYVDGQYWVTKSKRVLPGLVSFIGFDLKKDKLMQILG